jgi:hypothetical protein
LKLNDFQSDCADQRTLGEIPSQSGGLSKIMGLCSPPACCRENSLVG